MDTPTPRNLRYAEQLEPEGLRTVEDRCISASYGGALCDPL